jgi:thioredoxin 1
MKKITSLEEINEYINSGKPLLLYFSGENCSVCKVLKPKIKNEISINFPKIELFEIESDKYKEIASSFSVFSIPTILVFFDSKEFFRKGRNLSLASFIEELKRPYNIFME